MKTRTQVIEQAKRLAKKFVDKVDSGRAKSVETFHECKNLLVAIDELEVASELVITDAELLLAEIMTERTMFNDRGAHDQVKNLDRVIKVFSPLIVREEKVT